MASTARLVGLTLAVALGAGLFAAAQSRYPGVPTPVRETWEYAVVTEPTPSNGSQLNRYGSAGWELVGVVTQQEHAGNATRTQAYYYFKRQAAAQ